jgi:Protein of unknown function (DUF3592)
MNRIYFLLFGAAVSVIGIAQLVWSLIAMGDSFATLSWPIVTGDVISSTVVKNVQGRGTNFLPKVVYQYRIGEQSYENSKVWLTEGDASEGDAQSVAAAFTAGTKIPIHYDPKNQSRSVLYAGASWFSYVWIALSLICTIAGALILRHQNKQIKE